MIISKKFQVLNLALMISINTLYCNKSMATMKWLLAASMMVAAVAVLAVGGVSGLKEDEAQMIEDTEVPVTIENKCHFHVWPGVYPLPSQSVLTKWFVLRPNRTTTLKIKPWHDTYIWARTRCDMNKSKIPAYYSCKTGFCGSGYDFRCYFGMPHAPPVSTVFFRKLKYNIDLASGFNVPVQVKPNALTFTLSDNKTSVGVNKFNPKCPGGVMGCAKDVLKWCPPHMQTKFKNRVIACSASAEGNMSGMMEYFQHLRTECPCVHPITPPAFPILEDAVKGYRITFCPPLH